jgi:hypothetical protein
MGKRKRGTSSPNCSLADLKGFLLLGKDLEVASREGLISFDCLFVLVSFDSDKIRFGGGTFFSTDTEEGTLSESFSEAEGSSDRAIFKSFVKSKNSNILRG